MNEALSIWKKIIVNSIRMIFITSPMFILLGIMISMRLKKLRQFDSTWRFRFSISDIFVLTIVLSPVLALCAWVVKVDTSPAESIAACTTLLLFQLEGIMYAKLLADDLHKEPPAPLITGSAIIGGGFFSIVFLYVYFLVFWGV